MLIQIIRSPSQGGSQEYCDNLSAISFDLPPPFTNSSMPVELVEGAAAELKRVTRPGRKANRSALVATGMIAAAEDRLCSDGHWSTSNPDQALTGLRAAVAHAQRFVRDGLPARYLTLLAGWADVARGAGDIRS